MLLWINDDAFQEQPLAKLGTLISQLHPDKKQPLAKPGTLIKFQNNNLKFKVIGPAGSTTLVEMIKELQEAAELRKRRATRPELNIYAQLNERLEIYSAKATAEDKFLLRGVKEDPEGISNCQEKSEDAIAKKFYDCKITFHRTICSDKELVQALIEELVHRKLGNGGHIALIAEWDTFSSRSLLQTVGDVLKNKPHEVEEARIHRFSYLRSIDGKLPGERDGPTKERQKNGTERKEDKDKDDKDIQKVEEPIGRGQYDYLRRLADRIYQLDQQLGGSSIVAIGVLGSDFYDKYLILQALGQRLPDTIFFTTDLDARFLHPASIKHTRNLVVASGFGLQLREELQGDVPPFRDVYQTSVFLATRQAFNYPPHQLLQKTDIPTSLASSRLAGVMPLI